MITINVDKEKIGAISIDNIKNCPKMYIMILNQSITLDPIWTSSEVKLILDHLRGYKIDFTKCYDLALELELIEPMPDQSKINIGGKYFRVDRAKLIDMFHYFESFFRMHCDKHPDYTTFLIDRSPTIFALIDMFLKNIKRYGSDEKALTRLFGNMPDHSKTNILTDLDYFGYKNDSLFKKHQNVECIIFSEIKTIFQNSISVWNRIDDISFEKNGKNHYRYQIKKNDNTIISAINNPISVLLYIHNQDIPLINKIMIDDSLWSYDLCIERSNIGYFEQRFDIENKIEIISDGEITIYLYKNICGKYNSIDVDKKKITKVDTLNLEGHDEIFFPIEMGILSLKIYFEQKVNIFSFSALKNNKVIFSSNKIGQYQIVYKNGKKHHLFKIDFSIGYGKKAIINGDTISLSIGKKYNGSIIIEKEYVQLAT
jgi:hypothetical protein